MNVEIERKFRVVDSFIPSGKFSKIVQGYLSRDPGRIVRIRIEDDVATITIKGTPNDSGTTRFEWERSIAVDDAMQLMNMCVGVIHKKRYKIEVKSHTFEVDVFMGDNDGLILAELELSDESESYFTPNWIASEVTGISKYYNSQLSLVPYVEWANA